ncbi:Agmatinase [Bosea sp. 62]|uniref:arginase family protein n=1 Tax=unclassified Bosea (in: a-proteobacteria) TaxID=2653178 RepID=UPI00125751C2|nr:MULTISPECIES: arginase family protein [unclassified Bosea (in: a-proteobacteria)]CAD5263824.1 Agmatinase [Bosea sp. 46]CAD5266090.1 Agmatinase [Bosea sp. 21B]CAD5273582.1 Agmatinase [Bosea sp. 7B]VVT56611.1 Agmatinase [Bosea sp. EC-HK365B]VXB78835.1 Agmatinase [Bosea sp. 29B]
MSPHPIPGRAADPRFLDCESSVPEAVPHGAVAVIGIPAATPYRSGRAHSESAPAAIRRASAAQVAKLTHYDFDLGGALLPAGGRLADCGDLGFDPADLPGNRARIAETYATLLARGAAPLLLGGDDSVQIPALGAFAARGEITILQVDAHIDWREEVEGERFGLSSTMRRASEFDGVKTIVQVGARGTGSARPSDVAEARAAGAQLIDMSILRAKGMAPAIEAVPPGRPVVVCFDVDGFDPAVVPGVLGRTPGGLAFGDVVTLLNGVAERAPIIGFNIVEFVPEADIDGLGTRTVCRLAMLGAGLLARSAAR